MRACAWEAKPACVPFQAKSKVELVTSKASTVTPLMPATADLDRMRPPASCENADKAWREHEDRHVSQGSGGATQCNVLCHLRQAQRTDACLEVTHIMAAAARLLHAASLLPGGNPHVAGAQRGSASSRIRNALQRHMCARNYSNDFSEPRKALALRDGGRGKYLEGGVKIRVQYPPACTGPCRLQS